MANGTRAFALSGTNLIAFDPASPSVGTSTTITGIGAGETLVGIDFRPQNGMLYGIGVNPAADTATLYAISARTGVATIVGAPGGIAVVGDLPDPATTGYGFDFNPTSDRIRVTTDTGLNFRVNPNTGTLAGVDSPINGGTTSVDGAAYTNNQPNSTVTTLYTLDAVTNSLFIQNPANGGTQTIGQVVTLNGSPLDFTGVNGFDLMPGINVASSNAAVASGSALAALTVGGVTSLYSIDLVDATATLMGPILTGATPVSGLAVQSDLDGIPAIALSADGASLVRFNTATTGTTTTLAVTGIVAGETLVGIDFRPQTGQLYALGVNAATNTGTVYIVEPQNGAATAVGAPGGIAFVDGVGTPIDLPSSGYGFDFNPTVDRIRVTTDTGLNFRLNPNNGAAVDGDTGTGGTNPDSAINGLPPGSTGIAATAYTNSFGQNLAGGVTTQYTLDAGSDSLFIQNPPNDGTLTMQVAVTLAGSPLDFSSVAGFDIPGEVRVTVSGTVANGFGFAALTVGGIAGLYRIDLATGAATNLGPIGTGSVPLSGLTVGDSPSINAPPIAVDDVLGSVAVNSGERVITFAALTGNDSTGGDDEGDQTLTITSVDNAIGGTVALVGGTVVFTPAADFIGAASFDYTVSDNGTTDGTADPLSDIGHVTFEVTPAVGVTIDGTKKNDKVDATHTVKDQPLPGDGDDVIRGKKGDDKLSGLAGDDKILGGRGEDEIKGGTGDDELIGGKGGDTIRGGDGLDTFVLDVSPIQPFDKIKDYSVLDDTIVLDNAFFSLPEGPLAATAFAVGIEATDADDRIIYDSATGKLYFDGDGSGGGDALVFAKIDKGLALTHEDILVA